MSTTVEYDILIEVLDAVKDLKKLQQETKKSKRELDTTKKSGVEFAGQLGAAFTGISTAAGIVVGAVQKVAGAFIDAAVASFELSRSVVDNINDLNDLSARSSVSAQNIEALKLAFVSSGQSADSAKTIISQFPRVLTNLQKSGTQANEVLKALKVDPKNLKDGNQAFLESIRAIEGIENQTLKAQAATAIFGRSAGDLLQALAAGEFDEFTDSIERYGTKAGPEASKQAAEFQRRLALLGVVTDRSKQAFIQNTGALDFLIGALRTAQQAVAGLNVFLQNGQRGIRALASDIVTIAIKAFQALADNVISFVAGPFVGLLRAFDTLQEKVTGESLFGNAIERIAAFTIEQYDLNDALKAGTEAFEAEGRIIEQSNAALEQNAVQNKQTAAEVKALTKALLEKDKANKKETDSTKEAAKAEKERARKRKEMFLQAKAQSEAIRRGRQRAAEIEAQANSDLLSELDKINQREKERLRTLRGITAETGKSTEAAQRAAQERAARERGAFQQQQDVEAFGNIGQVLSAVISPQGLLDAVGQALGGAVGGAAAGVLGQFAALGDVSGIDADRLEEVMEATGKNRDEALKQILIEDKAEEFEIFFQAIVRGLQILPALLIQTLPPVIAEGALGLVAEIARLPIGFLGAIIEGAVFVVRGIGEFFTNLPEDLGKAILSGISDAFAFFFDPLIKAFEAVGGLFGGSFMSGGRFLSAQGGLRFTGREQGLAMLHSGETVVPRSGQMSSSVARDVQAQTGGGGVTININSAITERSAIDSLVRKIEDRFGSFGQSTSPLFGGQ